MTKSPAIPRAAADVATGSGAPARRRGWSEGALVAAAMACVVWFYYWTVEANTGFDDWGDMDYYRLLVRGWRSGQLGLDKAPSPGMLALQDPYDPAQNAPHRLPDASYYRGRYYLYFGAAPALTLMLPATLVTGHEMRTGAAVFVFCTVAFVAASGLWLAVRRRFFPESAVVVAPLGVLALGFGTHLLALAQRPSFWELPIAAGIAFTLLALVGVYRALHGSRPRWAMAGAGLALGLAVASRPTCLLAAPMLLAPLWLAWRERDGIARRASWQLALAAAAPLAACGVALMAYNYARFGNPLEFGQHYQLSGAYEGKWVHFSPRFLAHNIAVYFFQPVRWTWSFPFVAAQGVPVELPGYFGTEEVCGLAVTLPFVWFVLGLPFAGARREGRERRAWRATLAALAGALVPVALLMLSYFSTTARYQADFAVTFGVTALCGLLGWERIARRVRGGRAAMTALAVVVCGVTVAMGALVSLDYHGRALGRARPERWKRLEERAQAIVGDVGRRLGQFDGPRVLKVRFVPRPADTVETFWRASDPRADERILLRHLGENLISFGYARGAEPVRWGRPLTWERDHTHTVEVQVPSLYGPARGWLRGLRRDLEFRERTGVAVWFSGGRALDAVVAPWPAGLRPGGEVGSDFSGEVRGAATRLFREAEVRDPIRVRGDDAAAGVLQLRVVLPDDVSAQGEPLFAAGSHYGSDMVFARPAAGGWKLVFEHYGAPQAESAVMPRDGGEHVVDIVLPTFERRNRNYGDGATGDVVLRCDGREILRARQACFGFPPGSEEIGRNPFGTTCGRAFRGWILDAAWVR